MGVMQQRGNMILLLTLQPYRLEQSFWRSSQTRRGLMIADIAACITALVHASIMVYRLAAAEPGKSIFNIYFGPQLPFFSLGMQKIVYQGSALLLLLVIGVAAAGGRDYYAQHRHALCFMNRLLRFAFSSAQVMSSGVRNYVAPALMLRTQSLQQRPLKALMIITLHPVIFWLMQAHFVLPWRYAVLMQLANTAVALSFWSRQLPCFLQSFQLQQHSTSQLFYQQHASELCQALQYLGSGLRMALGDVTYALHDNRVCEGLRAVQVLQAFATIVGLLLLPLSVNYGIEKRFKRQFLRSLEQAEGAAAAAAAAEAAGATGLAAGSSSNSTIRTESSVVAAANGPANAEVDGGARSNAAAALSQVGEEPHCAVVLRWVACLLGLVVGSWLLAEVLVTDVFSRATCGVDV